MRLSRPCRRPGGAFALAALALLAACSESPPVDERMFVALMELPPLDAADDANGDARLEYVLWREDDTGTRPLERFAARSGIANLSLPAVDIDDIRTLFVTVERHDDSSGVPSRSILLAGDVIDGEAMLTTAHERALGTDFSGAVGTFRLAAPTSLTTDDFAQGLWWYDGEEVPRQSLFLPDLPQGWQYEGWIIGGGTARSTGKFADPARFDLDAAGASAGSIAPPPFPGQDYVFAPFTIAGLSAMITLEPNPDNSLEPSGIRVLFDQVIEELRVNQPMENTTDTGLPRGSVTTNRR